MHGRSEHRDSYSGDSARDTRLWLSLLAFAHLHFASLFSFCLCMPCLLFTLLFLCVFPVFPRRVFSPDSLLTAIPPLSHNMIASRAMTECETCRDRAQETVTGQQKPRWRNLTLAFVFGFLATWILHLLLALLIYMLYSLFCLYILYCLLVFTYFICLRCSSLLYFSHYMSK